MPPPPRPCASVRPPYRSGFTLVELLVSLSVLGILLAQGIPSLVDAWRAWQRDTAARAFLADLHTARSEAIKSSRRVVLCASSNGSTCARQDHWIHGWIAFIDEDDNLEPDTHRPLLLTQGPLEGLARMQANNKVGDFFFLPSGLMPTRSTTITLEPLGSASLEGLTITISSTGRTRVSKLARQP